MGQIQFMGHSLLSADLESHFKPTMISNYVSDLTVVFIVLYIELKSFSINAAFLKHSLKDPQALKSRNYILKE